MKQIFQFFLAVAVLLTTAFAQKTINDANAEKRTVGSFHGVDVGTGIKLVLTQGKTEEVAVSAEKTEYRDKIVTKVENGILKIYYENKIKAINGKKENKNLKAYVSVKNLDYLNASTGAEVKIESTIKSTSLKVKANTGATIKGTINSSDLSVDQNTGSIVTLSGDAAKLMVDGDTGSIFKGIDLKTENCTATAGTGAIVHIYVKKELVAKANTGGVVKYKGDAGIRDIKTNTGGTVSKI